MNNTIESMTQIGNITLYRTKRDFLKLISTITSCRTLLHHKTASKMAKLYCDKYPEQNKGAILKGMLELKLRILKKPLTNFLSHASRESLNQQESYKEGKASL